MDDDRFDALTRAFGSGRSRRGMLKTLGAAALGAVGFGQLGAATSAKGGARRRHGDGQFCPGGDCRICASAGQSCAASGECCGELICQGADIGPVCACPDGLVHCGSRCVDTTTNPRHCGACRAACPDGAVCRSGACCVEPGNNCTSDGECCGAPGCDMICVTDCVREDRFCRCAEDHQSGGCATGGKGLS